ncbi:MAG: GTPase [Anaerolineaceae bacterium]|jgi:small GTP-binding protein
MPTIQDFLNKLPPDTRSIIETLWGALPSSDQKTLLRMLSALPNDSNLLRLLLTLASRQYKVISGKKHVVAIVGPANVGKSTLYNQLIQQKQDRATVSPVPGTTRANQESDTGLFTIIDTPGADAVGNVGEEEKKQAMLAADQADFLVIMFDAIQGIKQSELQLLDDLMALSRPYIIVMNKMDLVRKEADQVLQKAAVNLHIQPSQIIPIIAKEGKSLSDIIMAIAAAEPSLVTALGRALPEYRWKLSWRTIASAASLSAAIALTPLPIIDFAPLIVTQSIMVLSIAKIYNQKMNLARARELVVTFGLGLLGRTLFIELSKLGGLPGWLLSAAIAASMTVVMGYGAVVLFERGKRLTGEETRQLSKNLTNFLLSQLKNLGKKKPDKTTLQETIIQSLDHAGLDRSPDILDHQMKVDAQEIVIDQSYPEKETLAGE